MTTTQPARGFVVRFGRTRWIGRTFQPRTYDDSTNTTPASLDDARVFATAHEAQQYARYGPVYSVAAARELEVKA